MLAWGQGVGYPTREAVGAGYSATHAHGLSPTA